MNIIVFGIIACEIGFWVFLIGGLALRYLAKQQRASTLLLLALPLLGWPVWETARYVTSQGVSTKN